METPVKQLFVNFILNQCSTAQKVQVLEYIGKGGYEKEWEAAMKEAEHLHQYTFQNSFDEERLYQNIKRQTGLSKKKNELFRWMPYAATILLVSAIGLFLLIKSFHQKGHQQLTVTVPQNSPLADRKWIKLPDGTSVQLNTGSHLDYPDSFSGKKNREVTLVGEAFFDVRHNAAHPFIIHTGAIRTTVLGTAFNVSAYQATQSVTVTVSRGKVVVQDAHKTLAVLTPNQQLLWTAGDKVMNKQTVDANAVMAWKASDLIMDDITLDEAAVMITRRYGVKVQFKNENVKNCRFTAAFLNRNDLSQVIGVLSDITGASLILKDGIITIDGQGC